MVMYQQSTFLFFTPLSQQKNEISLIFSTYLAMFLLQPSLTAVQRSCAAPGPVSFSLSAGRKTACARSIPRGGGRCHRRGHVACTMGSHSAVPRLC